ncbi:MAG: phosphatase PAP2 family protein [Bacteroidetes bacterium]|nr:phosphatase PAP2 family protein [Bacteroidota bacterium]
MTEPSIVRDLPDRVANVLTYLINPLILPPVIVTLAAAHTGASKGALWWIALSSGLLYFLIPVGVLLYLMAQSKIQSLQIRDRKRRLLPLVIGFGLALTAIPVIELGSGASREIVGWITGCFAVNILILLLITRGWKISLHVAGVVSLTAFLWWVASHVSAGETAGLRLTISGAFATFILTPLMMWSRLRTGAHTITQVIAGAAFGAIVPLAELYILQALKLFPS